MDNKPPKPKTPQKQNLEAVDLRDTFQTPNYATDLLVPFLENIRCPGMTRVWECAAGLEKISKRLAYWNYDCISTDLAYEGGKRMNFLTTIMSFPFDVIITNPPFSLKVKFYQKCLEYKKPFALLVPAEYAIWINKAVDKDGCEKIIPNRRIDYITPNILQRIHEGEVWKFLKERENYDFSMKFFSSAFPGQWSYALRENYDLHRYNSIYDVPAELLKKYSSSYYHSMWLTWGFNIGKSETFVELSNADKLNI